MQLTCPECKGTGRRYGEATTLPCSTCPDRSGRVDLDRDKIRAAIFKAPGVLYASKRKAFAAVYGAELVWQTARYLSDYDRGPGSSLMAMRSVGWDGFTDEFSRPVIDLCKEWAAEAAREVLTTQSA